MSMEDPVFFPDNPIQKTTRKCSKCKLSKNLEEFHKDPNYQHKGDKTGLAPGCKQCNSEIRKNRAARYRNSSPCLPEGGKKRCWNCGRFKTLKSFSKCVSKKDHRDGICLKCMRDRKIEKSYNITSREFNRLRNFQNRVCAICNRPETYVMNGKTRRLAIDHDHFTGEVRGLLCNRCNLACAGVEHFIRNKLLEKSISYLEEYGIKIAQT